jgi:hypothetical protein
LTRTQDAPTGFQGLVHLLSSPQGCSVTGVLRGTIAKFYNNMVRGFPLSTSRQQAAVDYATLVLSVVGTVVWDYGDKVF